MSNLLQKYIPFVYHVYMMIAEPRVRRLMYFVIYVCLMIAGSGTFFKPPQYLGDSLGGYFWIYTFASFIVLGSALALVAVLPGIWWLERAALIAIITGVGLYTITLLGYGASFLIVLLPIIVILICALRLLDIKEYLLAPREG
ncbi:membrane protein [Arthrobacter phage Sloopyjoe]|nr:membrane protein [Arthrobacter phage Sloopyjoe]